MRSAGTRRFLDVEGLASRRAVLAGTVEAVRMPRILEVVSGPLGAVAYRIEFAWDDSGRPKMTGHVEGTLQLVCQRCLDNFDWHFDSSFESLLVEDEHEVTDGQDAVVCFGGRIALEPTVEDEVLLALPNAPVHAYGSCEAPSAGDTNAQYPEEDSSPFSALRILRSRQESDRLR